MSSFRKRYEFIIFILIITFVLLVCSSFAWMSITTTPTLSDLSLNIISDNKFVIAPDNDGVAGEWNSKILFNLPEGSEMKPVTFSADKGCFVAPHYGWDGRVDFSDPTFLVKKSGQLDDSATADAEFKHLIVFDFWIKSEYSDCGVYLTPATEDADGNLAGGTYFFAEPVWNGSTLCHDEQNYGLHNAIRVAFYIKDDETGEEKYILYEPNYNGGIGSETLSIDTDEHGQVLPYNGVDDKYVFYRQSKTTFTEQDPVLQGSVIYQPGVFSCAPTNPYLFDLKEGEPLHVVMYIWVEGQDEDCSNATAGSSVSGAIQFTAEGTHSEVGPIRRGV